MSETNCPGLKMIFLFDPAASRDRMIGTGSALLVPAPIFFEVQCEELHLEWKMVSFLIRVPTFLIKGRRRTLTGLELQNQGNEKLTTCQPNIDSNSTLTSMSI